MYKEVVMCSECEYFYVNPEGMSFCNNKNGMPFPKVNDFCSNGKQSDNVRKVDNGELLKLVYAQRRN